VSFILAIILSTFFLELIWWWRADRLLRPLRHHRLWRALLAVFALTQALCMLSLVLGRFVLGEHPDDHFPRWLFAATFIWHLLVLPLTLVLWMLVSTGRGVFWTATRFLRGRSLVAPSDAATPTAVATPTGTTRRQFLGAAVAAAPPFVTAAATGFAAVQLSGFRVRPMTVTLPQLPPELDGMTIAHVTDIHVGRFTQGHVLVKIVEATNGLRSDLVLLTGDLINMSLTDLPVALDVVKRMDARYGVFMCEGNHDLMEDRREFERRTKASGIPLLVNESTVARVRGHEVQLLGLRWGSGLPHANRSADRGDEAIKGAMDTLLPDLRPDRRDAFPILLAHHPHAFDPAAAAGIPLTLSGHTHGGQLMFTPNFGFGPWMYRYWSGLYRKDDSALVVSNGVGNWFPLRLGAPAEILHLTLRRG
jgi:predicted MPP superfamily phosphohydrolase